MGSPFLSKSEGSYWQTAPRNTTRIEPKDAASRFHRYIIHIVKLMDGLGKISITWQLLNALDYNYVKIVLSKNYSSLSPGPLEETW